MSFPETSSPAAMDPILLAFQDFMADNRPEKCNLSVGMCYDESGKIPVMRAVAEAQRRIGERSAPWGYLMGEGLSALREQSAQLLFGEALRRDLGARVAVMQTLGGTGAVRLGAEMIGQLWGEAKIAVSRPTWMNHPAIFQAAGRTVVEYDYYDRERGGIQFEALLASLDALDPGTVVVLHGCCHNPTGADLDSEQWEAVADLLVKRRHIAFLDVAYAGFGEGLDADMAPVRLLASKNIPLFIALSFSKSFALYGERVGALAIVANSEKQAHDLTEMLKGITRTSYSTPPAHGALLVSEILSTPELATLWREELESMRVRIAATREALHACLDGGQYDFSMLTRQKGLFSYTGLSPQQIIRMRDEYAVHAVSDGRICIAAINELNFERVARALQGVGGK